MQSCRPAAGSLVNGVEAAAWIARPRTPGRSRPLARPPAHVGAEPAALPPVLGLAARLRARPSGGRSPAPRRDRPHARGRDGRGGARPRRAGTGRTAASAKAGGPLARIQGPALQH
ncbi:unnamed protein product [Urochloa humidicola]